MRSNQLQLPLLPVMTGMMLMKMTIRLLHAALTYGPVYPFRPLLFSPLCRCIMLCISPFEPLRFDRGEMVRNPHTIFDEISCKISS